MFQWESVIKNVSYSTLRLIWKCTYVPPHKLTKMVFFIQLSIMKYRVWKNEWKMATFSKMTKITSFQFLQNFKKTILCLQKFFVFLPCKFYRFLKFTEETLWFVKNGILTNHSKTSGGKSFLPCKSVFALWRPVICPVICPVKFFIKS